MFTPCSHQQIKTPDGDMCLTQSNEYMKLSECHKPSPEQVCMYSCMCVFDIDVWCEVNSLIEGGFAWATLQKQETAYKKGLFRCVNCISTVEVLTEYSIPFSYFIFVLKILLENIDRWQINLHEFLCSLNVYSPFFFIGYVLI